MGSGTPRRPSNSFAMNKGNRNPIGAKADAAGKLMTPEQKHAARMKAGAAKAEAATPEGMKRNKALVKEYRTKKHIKASKAKSVARGAHAATQEAASARRARQPGLSRLGNPANRSARKLRVGGIVGAAVMAAPSAIGEYQRHKESGEKMTKGKAMGIAYKLTGTPTPKSLRQDPT